MIVVAGPPRSGKTRSFPVSAFGVDGFNIDDRCAQILGSYRAIPRDVRRAVTKECERFVLDQIEHGQSFAVETTLRTTAAIDQALLAQRNGFIADMHFVATDSIDENIARDPAGSGWWTRRVRTRAPSNPPREHRESCRGDQFVRSRSNLRLDDQVGAGSAGRCRTRRARSSPRDHARVARRAAQRSRINTNTVLFSPLRWPRGLVAPIVDARIRFEITLAISIVRGSRALDITWRRDR